MKVPSKTRKADKIMTIGCKLALLERSDGFRDGTTFVRKRGARSLQCCASRCDNCFNGPVDVIMLDQLTWSDGGDASCSLCRR
mmetsp:Transcript_7897/g.11384  ORF Transcript_7897/g.11384 Transcript_7897/m.11384 type:complete len:83 (+) Transcript_7897:1-249(+)